MSTLLFISGSLRVGSFNTAAIRAARRIADTLGNVQGTAQVVLSDFPLFDEDVERAGAARSVADARELIRTSDAVVISTPAYNGAPPGALKNALDWLSRPADQSVLRGKLVATMSASPGRRGGVDAQLMLRDLLVRCGSVLIDQGPLVAIADAANRCSTRGELSDPEAFSQIRDLVVATVDQVRRSASIPIPIQGALV